MIEVVDRHHEALVLGEDDSVEEGGTPFRTPVGYLNVRKTENGVSFATVERDQERFELVWWCSEQYTIGECVGADLVLATTDDLEATLARALAAVTHCDKAHAGAQDGIRRQISQGFFERLLIGEDGTVVQAELTEPFAALIDNGDGVRTGAPSVSSEWTQNTVQRGRGAPDGEETAPSSPNRW